MAKPSVFRNFVTALRKHWRTQFPELRPVTKPLGPMMPKASTFYAGSASPQGLHVFVNFQHSPKAWEVGRFTVNIILSKCAGAPEDWYRPPPKDGKSFKEGSYRIGLLLGGKDKWWRLKEESPPIFRSLLLIQSDDDLPGDWRPTSYDSYEGALTEAIADVTRDVREALGKFGLPVQQ